MAPVMVFVTLCLTMSVYESKGDEHRLNYGIIFQKEKNLEFASENWIHTWRIDIPTEDQIQQTNYFGGHSHLSHLNNILFQLDTLSMRTATHLTQSRKLITDMIPEARTTPRFFKRALLSFVGDLASSIFGIASEKSVRTVEGHINALTK
jgi:hypothetical protein